MYCVDTNVFLDWWERRYPSDVFPSVAINVQGIANKRMFAPQGVFTEINHVGSAGLKQWAKANKVLFAPHDVPLQTEANAILTQFPGLIDPSAIHDEADRYVIALAKIRGLAVVTHETSAAQKRKPPRSQYIP